MLLPKSNIQVFQIFSENILKIKVKYTFKNNNRFKKSPSICRAKRLKRWQTTGYSSNPPRLLLYPVVRLVFQCLSTLPGILKHAAEPVNHFPGFKYPFQVIVVNSCSALMIGTLPYQFPFQECFDFFFRSLFRYDGIGSINIMPGKGSCSRSWIRNCR